MTYGDITGKTRRVECRAGSEETDQGPGRNTLLISAGKGRREGREEGKGEERKKDVGRGRLSQSL